MFDLRKPVASALSACEEPIGEWRVDAHGRPVQTTDFAVHDADGNCVATFVGTLRLYPLTIQQPDGVVTSSLPTRKQVIGLMRNPPPAPAPVVAVVAEEGAVG